MTSQPSKTLKIVITKIRQVQPPISQHIAPTYATATIAIPSTSSTTTKKPKRAKKPKQNCAPGRGVVDNERDAIRVEVMRQARRRQYERHALREGVGRDGGDEAGLARAGIADDHHLTARPPLARHLGDAGEKLRLSTTGSSGGAAGGDGDYGAAASASRATMRPLHRRETELRDDERVSTLVHSRCSPAAFTGSRPFPYIPASSITAVLDGSQAGIPQVSHPGSRAGFTQTF